jgi:hypothetical protein
MSSAGGNERRKHEQRNQHNPVGAEIDDGDQRTRAESRGKVWPSEASGHGTFANHPAMMAREPPIYKR